MGSPVAELLGKSNIVEVVQDQFDEASGSSKIVLRVMEEKPWIRMMSDLLKTTFASETFGLEVHKAFYAQQDAETQPAEVRFAWVVIHWGEADPDLLGRLAPILTRRLAAPPPFALGKAPATAPARAVVQPAVQRRAAPAQTDAQRADEFDAADDDVGTVQLRAKSEGAHRIKFERRVNTGNDEYEEFSFPLPHQKQPMFSFDEKKDGVVTMANAHGRFKARVQGRGEAEFSPSKGGGAL